MKTTYPERDEEKVILDYVHGESDLTNVLYKEGEQAPSTGYDWLGNKVLETNPLGKITRWKYDYAGAI